MKSYLLFFFINLSHPFNRCVKIPNWAQKPNLLRALQKQCIGPGRLDPDTIFPEVQTCDLEAIFDQKKSRYSKRASTGNWTKDRVTAAEKLTYKRKMGYAQNWDVGVHSGSLCTVQNGWSFNSGALEVLMSMRSNIGPTSTWWRMVAFLLEMVLK